MKSIKAAKFHQLQRIHQALKWKSMKGNRGEVDQSIVISRTLETEAEAGTETKLKSEKEVAAETANEDTSQKTSDTAQIATSLQQILENIADAAVHERRNRKEILQVPMIKSVKRSQANRGNNTLRPTQDLRRITRKNTRKKRRKASTNVIALNPNLDPVESEKNKFLILKNWQKQNFIVVKHSTQRVTTVNSHTTPHLLSAAQSV